MTTNTRLPRLFAVASLLIGCSFALVNPPLKVPDEGHHFARAYQVSQLQLLPQRQNQITGGFVPIGIESLRRRFETISYVGVSASEIVASRDITFDPRKTEFVNFVNTAEYPPVPYVPQAVGITVGRIFFRSALGVMYCGRLANLICYVALVYWALRLMPSPPIQFTLTLIALLPMSLHQAASLSADSMTIATAIFFVTMIWRLANPEISITRCDWILLLLSTIIFSLAKLAYAPFSFLSLLIPAGRFNGPRNRAVFIAVFVGMNFALVFGWVHLLGGIPRFDPSGQANPQKQMLYLLHAPWKIFPLFINTLKCYGAEIATGVIGTFGGNEYMLPEPIVVIEYAMLLVSVFATARNVNPMAAVTAIFVGTIVLCIISLLLYLDCMAVGVTCISIIQGRYFIPLLPLLIFLQGKNPRPTKWSTAMLTSAILISCFAVPFLVGQLYPAFPGSHFYFRFSGR